MNEIQQRLRQEIQLRRNVEEQLSKATATKTEKTINSAKLSEKSNVTLSFNKKCNNKLSRWQRQEKHEEADLQYWALVENEKRGTIEKYKKDMIAIKTRIKQLEELSRPQKETERSEKIDANRHGAIQKKRVEFSGRNTEVTAEEPKETNDNVNKEYLSSFMLTRRSNSGFSRDKPTDINLDFNPGQFYSSSFDGFNL
jgi:hypothetical protein